METNKGRACSSHTALARDFRLPLKQILQYRTVLGRTYYSEIGKAEGWTPNDERHSESMDMH